MKLYKTARTVGGTAGDGVNRVSFDTVFQYLRRQVGHPGRSDVGRHVGLSVVVETERQSKICTCRLNRPVNERVEVLLLPGHTEFIGLCDHFISPADIAEGLIAGQGNFGILDQCRVSR